ncbi:hypothetical protein KJ951_02680, partial [Patescibacteria group bacterium]|nr:hypothetical protein [Patescibacteria group bacterium]MBU1703286.1 hypothetical protein [Patescibacteria group bacterium]
GLWVGANPDFSKEPVAYYEDPNPLPLPHDGVIEFEFHYTSKTNKRELIIEKVKKLYAGLDPLIRAKRAKEYAAKKRAEDELNKRAKDL